MKKRILPLFLSICLLAGCASLLEREYSTVEPHSSKFWEREAAGTLRAWESLFCHRPQQAGPYIRGGPLAGAEHRQPPKCPASGKKDTLRRSRGSLL